MARDTSPTERRGYERPPIGDDWADAWDGLVEDSDELAVERGPIADRPSTGAYDDAFFYAVDQRTLWRWDAAASDWEAAAGLGTASDPVPGTSYFESVSIDNGSISQVAGRAYLSQSGQTILSDDETKVKIDAVFFEDANVTLNTSTNQIEILTAGKYLLPAWVKWNSDTGWTTGDRAQVVQFINENREYGGFQYKIGTGSEYKTTPLVYTELSEGDTVDIRVFQDSGADKVIAGGNDYRSVLQVIKIG